MAIVVIILVFACGLIAFYCYLNRHPYKPQPLQYVTPRDCSQEKLYCKIHNYYYGNMGVECPVCRREYSNDVIAGVFPPGIDESNKNFFHLDDWIALRKIDFERDQRIKDSYNASDTKEEREAKVAALEKEAIQKSDSYIKNTIAYRIATLTKTSPEAQWAKMQASVRRHHYAGSAQYSGMTPNDKS